MVHRIGNLMHNVNRPTGVVAVAAQETPSATNFARIFSVEASVAAVSAVD